MKIKQEDTEVTDGLLLDLKSKENVIHIYGVF